MASVVRIDRNGRNLLTHTGRDVKGMDIGDTSGRGGDRSIALGKNSICTQQGSVAIGYNADSKYSFSDGYSEFLGNVAIGNNAKAYGPGSVVIGTAELYPSVDDISWDSRAYNYYSVALGTACQAGSAADDAAAPGTTGNHHAIGGFAQAGTAGGLLDSCLAIGQLAVCNGSNSVVIGRNSSCTGENSFVVGRNSAVTAADCITIGYNADATHAGAIVMGKNIASQQANCLHFGNLTTAASAGAHSTYLIVYINGTKYKLDLLADA
jgi:trimeric autotransporter adhesin